MTAFLILVAAIAVGVLMSRFYAKRGYSARMRRVGSVSAGVLVLVLGALVFGPTNEAPASDASASTATPTNKPVPPAAEPPPQYAVIDADSMRAAEHYIANLDGAIDHSVAVLPGADIKTVAGISRHFHELAEEGDRSFGSDVQQLGYCGMAGSAANALWQARLVGREPTGADIERIQQARQGYEQARGYCLARLKG